MSLLISSWVRNQGCFSCFCEPVQSYRNKVEHCIEVLTEHTEEAFASWDRNRKIEWFSSVPVKSLYHLRNSEKSKTKILIRMSVHARLCFSLNFGMFKADKPIYIVNRTQRLNVKLLNHLNVLKYLISFNIALLSTVHRNDWHWHIIGINPIRNLLVAINQSPYLFWLCYNFFDRGN